MGINGIDLSDRHGRVDWWSVAAGGGAAFAFVEATEGMTSEDPSFGRNWLVLREVGLTRGAYHCARPSQNAADEEADHFLARIANVGLRRGDLLALDMSDVDATGNLHDWTLVWLERVASQVGFQPLLRSRPEYMQPHGLIGYDDLAQYPLWYSTYTERPGWAPPAPNCWTRIVVHQYTDRGRVAGLNQDVDLNWFTGGSIVELRSYGSR